MNRTIVPPPVTLVMDAAERLAAGPHGGGRGAAAPSWPRATASRSRPTRRRRSPPGESACARCWSCSAPGRGRARRRSGPRLRSSWSTWRPSSTTTSSTRRRFAAATRPWWRARAATARWRSAICCSREPSPSSAANGSRRQVELLSAASVALALGELAQRRDAFDGSISRRALPGALRAEDRAAVRVRVPDRTGGRRRGRAAGAADRSPPCGFGREIGLAFQLLDDVLDVSGPARAHRQGPRHGPARRHRDPAADPRSRARSTRWPSWSCEGWTPAGAEAVCDRIAATGVLEEVRAGARRRVELAKRALERSALDAEQRQLLGLVADGVVERYS